VRNTAIDEDDFGALCSQSFGKDSMRHLGDGVAARKEIDGGVTAFRPGVDREMGLFHHDYACHALWLERLKDRCDDVRAGCFGGLVHQRFYSFEVIQYRRVAARVFNE
jgi:hypothetical protein